MKYILTILLLLPACKKVGEGDQADIFTMRHEGLCFVVYDNYHGAAMVQVDCNQLQPEEYIHERLVRKTR